MCLSALLHGSTVLCSSCRHYASYLGAPGAFLNLAACNFLDATLFFFAKAVSVSSLPVFEFILSDLMHIVDPPTRQSFESFKLSLLRSRFTRQGENRKWVRDKGVWWYDSKEMNEIKYDRMIFVRLFVKSPTSISCSFDGSCGCKWWDWTIYKPIQRLSAKRDLQNERYWR